MSNQLNAYETIDLVLRRFPSLNKVAELTFHSEFYQNDTGGYILSGNGITYYLLHHFDLDLEWTKKTNYDRMESDAFFVPIRFIERATLEEGKCCIMFVIDNAIYYILPIQLKAFYMNNNLQMENGFGEVVIPVPLKLLTTTNPYI